MSSLTMPAAVTPTLPAVNLLPHGHGGHGHKKGSPLDPTADSSSTATPSPVGTAQNLLGSLFSSLQQVIGGTPLAAVTNLAASATNAASGSAAAGSTAAAAAAAASKINVMA
jgi:hypothetical protein